MALKVELYSRDFYCEECRVEFRIMIEPNTDINREHFAVQYPRSVAFLKEIKRCPVCLKEIKRG